MIIRKPSPVTAAEFEIELLAFNTRPAIAHITGPYSRLLGNVLELPISWFDAEPGPRLRARRRNTVAIRAARRTGVDL